MSQYIVRRFLQMIPIAFGILTLVFSLIHLIPGDPARQIAGENARPEDIIAVRKALGLDQPLWTQYITYVSHVIRGDFGRSFQTNEAVSKQIAERYPATIELAFGAMAVALIVAFPLGIISAIYRNSWIDNVARFFALIGVSMPSFWFGPLLIIAFAINHTWFPVSGREEGLRSLVLPAVTMGLALAAILTRMIRVSLAEELTQLYVTTAIAKGATRSKAIFRHALKNALIPVITVLALQNQLAPPTLRLNRAADDCTLDYVPHTPRPLPMTNVLSNTFGFGGSNVSLLFSRVL